MSSRNALVAVAALVLGASPALAADSESPAATEPTAEAAKVEAPGFWDKHAIDWGVKVGVAAYALFDLDDEKEGKPFRLPDPGEDVSFGIMRASFYFWGGWADLAKLKVHFLSLPIKKSPNVEIADAHLTLDFHEWVHLKGGKFKKTFTRVFTPQWFMWNTFDLPQNFIYTRTGLGLGGRDFGVFLFGGNKKSVLYHLGVFNGGLEAAQTSGRSNEGVQIVSRLETYAVDHFHFGTGFTYQTAGKVSTTKPDPNDPNATITTTRDEDTLAYAANVSFMMANFDIDLEWIGTALLPDSGSAVLGGGFYGDLRYSIPLPKGRLIPGVRAAMHWLDFDEDKMKTSAYTGTFYWQYQNSIRAGVELSYLDEQAKVPKEVDRQSMQAMLHLQLIH